MRSFSLHTNNGGGISPPKERIPVPDNMDSKSPFLGEEELKEEPSRLEETPNKKSKKSNHILDEEDEEQSDSD